MQTGADLVSAGYATSNPVAALLGQTTNATQPNLPARSNLHFGTILGTLSDAAISTTGQGLAVAVPALPGDVITKVTVLVGATSEASGTHGYFALYSGVGTPALLAQTLDITTAGALAAGSAYTATLASAVTLNSATCPNGFIYADLSLTANTMPTLISSTVPTQVQTGSPNAVAGWYANGPQFLAATHGSALAGAPPATLTSLTVATKVPIIVLT